MIVTTFDENRLLEILAQKSHSRDLNLIKTKWQVEFLLQHLKRLGVCTMVVETDYVDRDFLEDYAQYYVKSFGDFEKHCTRVHFFSSTFEDSEVKAFLVAPNVEFRRVLESAYCGFLVIKPLPETIVGRTCLKILFNESDRVFALRRNYKINLFGVELEVQSLAFQEQDQEVAACATSALWSAFHMTSVLFNHPLLSPVEITKASSDDFPIDTLRSFPNRGLSFLAMANAIRKVGLEPYSNDAENVLRLKRYAYAYLRARLPVLLGVELHDGDLVRLGLHAICLSGYRLTGLRRESAENASNFVADGIVEFFAHDDQIGPYTPVEFTIDGCLMTKWRDANGRAGSIFARPDSFLVPIYHKIRIPVENAYTNSLAIADVVTPIIRDSNPGIWFEWDLFLSTVTDLRSDLLSHPARTIVGKDRVLTKNLPRFIWRLIFLIEGSRWFEILFDATSLIQGPHPVGVLFYDDVAKELVHELCAVDNLKNEDPIWRDLSRLL